jgi:transcriptional regulator with XRE-family HTH domain
MTRPLDTIAQRVAWAIEASGRTKIDIAKAIGCTHAALSQWTSGRMDVTHSRVSLLMGFCRETHVRLEWLLTGDGPARESYPPAQPLVVIAREIAARDGALAEQAERVLRAMAGPTAPE